MSKITKAKISDLKFDNKNFNKGTQFGDKLLEKSISKFGFREAGVLDRNGRLIGGNKRTAKAGERGLEDVEIIKADPNKIYALQFDDIDLDSPEGRELALALNATATANISFDVEVMEATIESVKVEEWGAASNQSISANGNLLKHYEVPNYEEDEDDEELYNTHGDNRTDEVKDFEHVPLVLYIKKSQNSILKKYRKSMSDTDFTDLIIKALEND